MIGISIAVLMASLVCLAFAATRIIGVVGLLVLLYLYPVFFVAIALLGGVAFYFYYRH